MKKLLRISAFVLLGAVVLVAAAAAIAPRFIHPNDHRERIAALVGERTGRALRLGGPISLSVFPWLGVDMRDVVLGNAPGFEDPIFARADRLEVRVKLLPLLRKRVEMDAVKLYGLQLRLARDASGASNWDDLAASAGSGGTASAEPARFAALALGGVEVADGQLSWDDRQGGQRLEVRGISLDTGALRLGAAIPFEASFDLVATAPALAGRVSASGEVAFDIETGRVRASGLEASATVAGAAVPSGKGTFEVTGEALYDPGAGRIETGRLEARADLTGDGDGSGTKVTLSANAAYDIARQIVDAPAFEAKASELNAGGLRGAVSARGELRLDLAGGVVDARGLAFAGDLRGAALPGGELVLEAKANARADIGAGTVALTEISASTPKLALPGGVANIEVEARSLAGSLDSRRLRASRLGVSGTLTGERMPGGALAFDARADVDLDLGASKMALSGLEAGAGDLRATGEATITNLGAKPNVTANLAVAGADLRALAAIADVELPATRDPKVLATLAGEASFSAGAGRLDVERMRVKLDDSTIEGSVRIAGGSLRGARFDLSVDQLDADRYLAPQASAASASPGAAAVGAAGLPVAQLRALDLDGRLRIGRLRTGGLDLAGVDARIAARDGLIRLSPARAALYGGTYAGNVTVDARRDTVAVTLDERLESVDASALTRALGADAAALGLTAGKSTVQLSGSATGDPATGRYRLRGVALDADVAGARFPNGRLGFSLGGGFDVNVKDGTATSDSFALRFGGLEATGKLALTRLLDDPHFAGTVATSRFNPRTLLGELGVRPPVTSDPKALASASLQATVTGSARALSLKGMALELDQSRITGDVEVRGFDQPTIRADLDIDAIDADRYLPPSTPRVAAPPGAAVMLLPVETLRALDLDGEIRIGQLRLGGVNASNARITAKAKDGQARIHPVDADLYGGVYRGDVTVDARTTPPSVSLNERLSGAEIGALITDVKGSTRISGRAEISAQLSARGETTEALTRTLGGVASVELRDGAFRGMNLTRRICEALAGQPVSAQAEGDGALTRFTSLTGTANVRDGVIVNRDLQVSSPLLRITGAGGASLVTRQVNFGAKVMLEDACRSEQGLRLAGIDFAQIGATGVPIRCQGTFDRPGCGPDAQFAAPLIAQQVIQRAVGGSLGNVLQGESGGAVNSILEGLLNPQ